MKKLFLLFGFINISLLNVVYSQVQSSYIDGDTVYRYSCDLTDEVNSFKSLQLQFYNFPCVDELIVKTSDMEGIDIELKADGYREFYSKNATELSLAGYEGLDPFLSLPNYLIHFDDNFPIVRSNRKDDFFNTKSTEFQIVYHANDFNGELKQWAVEKSVSEIRILCGLDMKNNYKFKDEFDNLYKNIEGFVIENEFRYFVKTMEIKSGDWQKIDKNSVPVLRDNFDNSLHKYLSFYSYESLAEVARITSSPRLKFYYNSNRKTGRQPICVHRGSNVYIYPNPTFGELKAKFSNAESGDYKFSIINLIGKTLWSRALNVSRPNQEISLELPFLSKGVYMYTIIDPKGKRIQSRRLILVEP